MKVLLNKFVIPERNLFYKIFLKSHLKNILLKKFFAAMKNLFSKTFIVIGSTKVNGMKSWCWHNINCALGFLRTQFWFNKRAAGGYGSGYGYQKYPQKVWAPSRARSASDNHLNVYLYSYTNKTVGLEAIFNIPCFQSSKKPKCPMCCPYGPTDLSYKIWGHAASVCPFCKDLNFSQFIV